MSPHTEACERCPAKAPHQRERHYTIADSRWNRWVTEYQNNFSLASSSNRLIISADSDFKKNYQLLKKTLKADFMLKA